MAYSKPPESDNQILNGFKDTTHYAKKIIPFAWLLLSVCCLAGEAFGQTEIFKQNFGKFVPASPTATAIATYQQYPIDFVTGAPQIDIPLFEVNTKMGKIPFSLSYHIGRLKGSELNGPIGFGWTLMPNLGISRSVNGRSDNLGTGYNATNSNFGIHNDCYYLSLLAKGAYDEEPDDFYYNLLSKSGGFMHKRGGGFAPNPYEAVKISRPNDNAFEIIDDDGTLYKFGRYSTGTTNVVEVTEDENYNASEKYKMTAWKLTEIISYDKTDTVQFVYGGTANRRQIPYYNYQWRITEYPNRFDMQPKIHKSEFRFTSGCFPMSGMAGWAAMRTYGGAASWNSSSVNWFDIYDLPPYEYNPTGLYTLATPLSACYGGSTMPMSCGWYTDTQWDDQTICSSLGGVFHCTTITTAKDVSVYLCLSGNTTAEDVGSDYVDEGLIQLSKVDEHQLTDILFRGGKVSLTYDASKVSTITLYTKNANNQYEIIKSARLFRTQMPGHTYQPSVDPTFADNRFLLDSVQIRDKSGTPQEVYKMDYTPGGTHNLAANFVSDFFGFASSYKRPDMVPQMDYPIQNYHWQYHPDAPYSVETNILQLGSRAFQKYNPGSQPTSFGVPLLKTLTLPTGGSANFLYEKNRFQYWDTTIVEGGNVRIKQITYKDALNRDSIVKSYRYGVDECGYGLIRFLPERSDFVYQQTVNSTNQYDIDNVVQKVTTITSNPFSSMLFAGGAAVNYPEVTEYTGKPGQSPGKTVYKYNVQTGGSRKPNSPIQVKDRDEWSRNGLQSVSFYKSLSPSTYQLIKKVEYINGNFNKDTLRAGSAYLKYTSTVNNSEYDNCQGNYIRDVVDDISYVIQTGGRRLMQEKETTYDGLGDSIIVAKNYTYDPVTLLRNKETVTTSKGAPKELKIWYPSDAATLTGWPVAQQGMLTALTNANRLNTVVKTEELLSGTPLSSVSNHFGWFGGRIYPSEMFARTLSNPDESRAKMLKYDRFGNVVSIQKTNDIVTSYIWDYKSIYPIAEANNADSADIAYTSFETEQGNGWSGVNTGGIVATPGITGDRYYSGAFSLTKTGLSTGKKYQVSYWSRNGAYNVTGSLAGSPRQWAAVTIGGVTWTCFEHEVTGVTSSTLSGSGIIDEVRICPVNAQMSTYTYRPMSGISSVSDTNHRIIYYEYDEHGRLKLIKDQHGNILKLMEYQYRVPAQ
ncbi:hypothetical protein MKQ68_10420 [Chitinophaga horti]|uniref:YD repeat-containing protein n=1 Tax=Chitinophaga horti TaxID=2920382 RepID=A0ABY6JBF4_9BACT|nr:hypothetical protein [Chitinophaga horti]UYQ95514.1 hypothetical protein MKQ68_10420 [Chitinophaga horti]